jgi:predicted RNase H-like HicB family nuclease
MTPFFDLGGHPIRIVQDRFADGRTCIVAEHPDLPGCLAYAETPAAAVAALKEARSAYLASIDRHTGQAPAQFERGSRIDPNSTASSGAESELQVA